MNATHRRAISAATLLAIGAVFTAYISGAPAGPVPPATTVIMTGLDNPRGMAFGPEGGLYVAEAGRGGAGPCVQLVSPPEPRRCWGLTGAISRLFQGQQSRIISGLPSLRSEVGTDAGGVNGISFLGRGGAYITIGSGGNPALRAQFGPMGAMLGTVIHLAPGGPHRVVADIAAYEAAANPGGGLVDSNAFGILALPAARLVTDAGGNSLLLVKPDGEIGTLAVFPSRPARPTDSVPTSVAVGPDGAYYVGELSGVPFAAGAATVYSVVPGLPPQPYATGLQTVIDIEFGPDGSLYVLQHATGVFFSGPGEIIRIAPDMTRHMVLQGLDRPTSLIVDSDGTLYVTNHGVSIGTGEVLRVAP